MSACLLILSMLPLPELPEPRPYPQFPPARVCHDRSMRLWRLKEECDRRLEVSGGWVWQQRHLSIRRDLERASWAWWWVKHAQQCPGVGYECRVIALVGEEAFLWGAIPWVER